MIYSFDIDGTICSITEGDYERAEPFPSAIAQVNNLYRDGYYIKLFTARGSTTAIDWRDLTSSQLQKWGVCYHELILGKPEADLFIDDKSVHPNLFFCTSSIKQHYIALFSTFTPEFLAEISIIAKKIYFALSKKNRLFLAGNGGSFAECLHFAAELTGRFKIERDCLPAIVLGSNPASISAIANDYSYDDVFSRELRGLSCSDDILICYSTSGTSPNIINALKEANKNNVYSILVTSEKLDSTFANATIKVKSDDTARIQEMHTIVTHLLCESIDDQGS